LAMLSCINSESHHGTILPMVRARHSAAGKEFASNEIFGDDWKNGVRPVRADISDTVFQLHGGKPRPYAAGARARLAYALHSKMVDLGFS